MIHPFFDHFTAWLKIKERIHYKYKLLSLT